MAKNLIESTGLVNAVQNTDCRKNLLDGGFIKFYGGVVPADADDDCTGNTLLCTLTESDDTVTGLTFEPAVTTGILTKLAAETWAGTPIATGVSTFYRWEMPGDTQTASTSEIRVQGTVGLIGTDMIVNNTTFTVAVLFTLPAFLLAQPKRR